MQRGAHPSHRDDIQVVNHQAEQIALVDLDGAVTVTTEHRGGDWLKRGVGERQRHVITRTTDVADAEVEVTHALNGAFRQAVERSCNGLTAVVVEDDERHPFHRQKASAHAQVEGAVAEAVGPAHIQLVVVAASNGPVKFHRESGYRA